MKYLNKYKLFEMKDTLGNRKFLIKKIEYALTLSIEQLYSSADLELETDPVYYSNDEEIALINNFTIDKVGYDVYGGYKKETVIDSGVIPYSKLDFETLEEIWELIKESIELDMIQLNMEIKNQEYYEKLIFVLSVNGERDYIRFPDTYKDYLLKQKTDEYNI